MGQGSPRIEEAWEVIDLYVVVDVIVINNGAVLHLFLLLE